MSKRKIEIIVGFLVGLLLIFFGWFNYAIYTPVNSTDSSRLKNLNWLHENLGRIPTALIFGVIGLMMSIYAFRKIIKKKEDNTKE